MKNCFEINVKIMLYKKWKIKAQSQSQVIPHGQGIIIHNHSQKLSVHSSVSRTWQTWICLSELIGLVWGWQSVNEGENREVNMFMSSACPFFTNYSLYRSLSLPLCDRHYHSVSVFSCLYAIRAELDGAEHTGPKSALQVEANLQ